MLYLFVGLLPDSPYFSISILLSLPTQHIYLFCSPFPLSTSLCFALPSHSTHLSVLLSLPTQHISLFCSPFPLSTLHSSVPQSTALSLLSRSVYFTQLSRPVSHFLPTANCLSVVTVSAVPLYPNCARSWTFATVRATCDCGMDIRDPPWYPRSCNFMLHPNFSSVSQAITVILQSQQSCSSQLTHSCIFPKFLSPLFRL